MPTNLPAQAKAKWVEATAEKDPRRKLVLLREFYSMFPKHKGTERLEMALKRQIAGLKDKVEKASSRKTGSTRLDWVVKKESGLHVAVIGTLDSVCRFFGEAAGLPVQIYQLLTAPVVGILRGVHVRLVLVASPVDSEIGEEKQDKLINLARGCDAVLIIGERPSYVDHVSDVLEKHNVRLKFGDSWVEVEYASSGGIRISGSSLAEVEVKRFLEGFGVKHALVKMSDNATLDDLESELLGFDSKIGIVVGGDGGSRSPYPTLFAERNGVDKDALVRGILRALDAIRVFTRTGGETVYSEPLLLKKNSTTAKAAEEIHRELARGFKYAKVWRKGSPRSVRVGRNFLLTDGDVIEIQSD